MKPSLNITKLDAAKRQLESAILLYFNHGDPVSIHTLCAAAYDILRDLNKKREGDLMLKDLWQFLDAEKAKGFRQQVNEAQNFFKHADEDSDSLFTLDPQWTEVLLADASRKYMQLTGEYSPYLKLFMIWFVMHHQDVFREDAEIARVLESAKTDTIPDDRHQFFVQFLPSATRLVST